MIVIQLKLCDKGSVVRLFKREALIIDRIESNEVSMNYCLQSGDFKSLSENPDNQNTALFVLQSLADDVSFSTDFDSLITTFHVKTKIRVQRTLQHQEVRKEIFS